MDTDAIWLAGLLEGEGCFIWHEGRHPMVKLSMTDGDVVHRAVQLAPGCPPVIERERTGNDAGKGYKNIFVANWCGKPAINLMWRILPHMGERRSAKILDIIADWNELRFATCAECSVGYVKPDAMNTTYCSPACRTARNLRVSSAARRARKKKP